MDDQTGYFTKELDDGRFELLVGVGDGVLLSNGIFNSIDEIDRYLEENAD